MTDKEPIIIDGVDVSKCEFYMHYDYGKFSHGCSLHKDMFGLPVCCDIADCCKDCYFKQLARKTQECEQIKEKYEALKLENQEGYEIVAELEHEREELKERLERVEEDLKHQCVDCMNIKSDRYRKALEEIEKYLKEECGCECADCLEQGDCHFQEILDIINKAKGKSNG